MAPLEAALEAAAAAARRGAGLARRLLAVALGGAARPLRLRPLPPGPQRAACYAADQLHLSAAGYEAPVPLGDPYQYPYPYAYPYPYPYP